MKPVFLLIFILALSVNSFGQRKKDRKQEQEAYELKMKQEWDAYLVKVEQSKELKAKQKVYNDSVKLVMPKKEFEKCDKITTPIFLKKDNLGNAEEILFNDYLNKHIKKYFTYPDFALEHNIQGRVLVNFVINDQGFVEKINVFGPENGLILEEEAVRIISKLPKFIPAMCDNQPISIRNSIPIVFRLQ